MIVTLIGYLVSLLVGLIITILVEYMVIYLYGLTEPKVLKTAFYVNLITNPAMNIVLSILSTFFGPENVFFYVLILEIIVIIVELKLFTLVYQNIFNRNTILKVVISMNVVSFLIGLLLSRLNFLSLILLDI